VLSTDDPEIAAVGATLGLDVPFLRPPELAADDTPMLAVLQHALDAVGDEFDALCLLQPTSPVRAEGLIDECIELLDSTGADAVATVMPVPQEHNPHWVYECGPDGSLHLSTGEHTPIGRRQDLPAAFHRDGSVYVFRPSFVHAGRPYGQNLRGVVVDPTRAVNIDDPDDWARAEALIERGR
jgi:CMP-N-acetylneuraminic acid synthetase